MSGKFRDFDEFRAEVADAGPSFQLFGKTWHLPGSLPVALMARAVYLEQSKTASEEIAPSEIMELAWSIFGRAAVDEWQDNGLDVATLAEMIRWATEAYDADDAEADPGN